MDPTNEPALSTLFEKVLLCASDKDKSVGLASEEAATSFCKNLSKPGVALMLPIVLRVSEECTKWQVKLLCCQVLQTMCRRAPVIYTRHLPVVVPVLSALMWETKKAVKKAATKTMKTSCKAIENKDLKPFVPALISCINDPDEVIECIYKLASTTFVQTVEAGTLALTCPLLIRGYKERGNEAIALTRKCAVITENMAKLVEEPTAARPFLPELMPLLERAKDEIADQECRMVCNRAYELLCRIKDKCESPEVKAAEAKVDALEADAVKAFSKAGKETAAYAARCVRTMVENLSFTENSVVGALAPLVGKDVAAAFFKTNEGMANAEALVEDDDDDEEGEELCNCKFSLAYGSKILLNNAKLNLKRGMRYGIVAQKSAGKTTLLTAIANYQVEGFPPKEQLKTVFVDTDVQGFKKQQNVGEYCHATVGEDTGSSLQDCIDMLLSVGFTQGKRGGVADVNMPITGLSGGWRMKLALARAMLRKADILLMDEPTNHLDVLNVQWVVDYLTGEECKNVTSLIVSHDTKFLDNVATHVIHFSDLKLKKYAGNLSKFVERFPETKSYYDLKATNLKFKFPQPGPLQGVRSRGKAILTMNNVAYRYPVADFDQITGVTLRVSMASRVACVGANGAGKSTLIKVLTGENEPTVGSVTKHPNCRMAYVAQHAFHHIEQHLDKTPNQYIQWRYQGGEDKEALNKSTVKITEEEEKKMKKPIEVVYEDEDGKRIKEKRVVEKVIARRKEGKKFSYEVKWINKSQDLNTWYDRDTLGDMGFEKLMTELDRRLAAMEGSYQRTLSARNVEEHLENVGLERELGTHNRISALSGGQKVKVVLGACTWMQPHLIILDEPTNYLDREALGALANAIDDFEGGVVLITHNKEFADVTTRETWVVANHKCDIKGDAEWEKYALEQLELAAEEDMIDAAGNKLEIKRTPASIKAKDKKKMSKEIKKKIKGDEEMTDFEHLCATEWGLWV